MTEEEKKIYSTTNKKLEQFGIKDLKIHFHTRKENIHNENVFYISHEKLLSKEKLLLEIFRLGKFDLEKLISSLNWN